MTTTYTYQVRFKHDDGRERVETTIAYSAADAAYQATISFAARFGRTEGWRLIQVSPPPDAVDLRAILRGLFQELTPTTPVAPAPTSTNDDSVNHET